MSPRNPELSDAEILASAFLEYGPQLSGKLVMSIANNFTIDQLLKLGWIVRAPGRWNDSYIAGPDLHPPAQN